jgi:hypothetical protein
VIPRWEGHDDARPTPLLWPIPRSLNVSYVGPPSKIPTGGGPTAALGAVMEHQTWARPDGFTTDGRRSSAQTYRQKSLLWLSPSPSRW